jgi:putative nucleotidyltransferase with HDIG domain
MRQLPGEAAEGRQPNVAELAGELDEALAQYGSALERARAAGDRRSEYELLRSIGRVHTDRGDYERARAALEASLAVAGANAQRLSCAAALNGLAAVAQFQGQLSVAESLYLRAGSVADQLGDERLGAMVDQNLGTLAGTRGETGAALDRHASALGRFRRLGDDRSAVSVLMNMARLQMELTDWSAVELSLRAARQLTEHLGECGLEARLESAHAELYLKRQSYERAREHCDAAFRHVTQLASPSGLAEVHRLYGVLYRETGKPQLAHLHLMLALRLAQACENPLSEADTERERARLFLEESCFQPALLALNRAYGLYAELDARREIQDLARRLEQLEPPYCQALQLWTEQEPALQTERTGVRGARVGLLAAELAAAVGLPAQATTARIAAYVHDVGMAAVPREIISKRGPLTEAERRLVQQHTASGEQVARELDFPVEVLQVVRHHHERWDGRGYPDALEGSAIPVLARIVCIADVYDALTTPRPYRAALPPGEALSLMLAESGRQFDPELFDVFCGVLAASGTFTRRTTMQPSP